MRLGKLRKSVIEKHPSYHKKKTCNADTQSKRFNKMLFLMVHFLVNLKSYRVSFKRENADAKKVRDSLDVETLEVFVKFGRCNIVKCRYPNRPNGYN